MCCKPSVSGKSSSLALYSCIYLLDGAHTKIKVKKKKNSFQSAITHSNAILCIYALISHNIAQSGVIDIEVQFGECKAWIANLRVKHCKTSQHLSI